jgi:hypothetical protein
VLRVQTHPQQQIKIGDEIAVAIDAAQCSVFRQSNASEPGDSPAAKE